MATASSNNGSQKIRFGLFEADLRSGELFRDGSKVRLQEQPFQILAMLLDRAGEVVTREEMRERLWPADTFVDFDHSLNAAIRRLRDALGDTAENPRFVATVARRGYRFLAPVDGPSPTPQSVEQQAPTTSTVSKRPLWRRLPWIIGVVAVLVIGISIGFHVARRGTPTSQFSKKRLTANPPDVPVRLSALSTDGKYLAFADPTGFYIRDVNSGETHSLPLPESFGLPGPAGYPFIPMSGAESTTASWFPDNNHLVFTWPIGESSTAGLWEISTFGGTPRKLAERGQQPSVSPDGSQVAFVTGSDFNQELWLMQSNGEKRRKLRSEPLELYGSPAWSPDGKHLAFVECSYGKGLMELNPRVSVIDLPTGQVSNLMSLQGLGMPLAWTPDNRLVYSLQEPSPNQNDSNLWVVSLDPKADRTWGQPTRLTNDPGIVASINISRDGKKLAYSKHTIQPDVYIAELESNGSRLSTPRRLTLDERQDYPFAWTPDSKSVIFTSDRNGTFSIYRQSIDKFEPELFLNGKEQLFSSRLTPDGSSLLYLASPLPGGPSAKSRLMRVPLSGGPPQTVFESPSIGNFQCARLPATVCILSTIETDKLSFFYFDPMKGIGNKINSDALAAFYYKSNWSLSPDGRTFALARLDGSQSEPQFQLVSLADSSVRTIPVRDCHRINFIDWAADGKSLWIGGSQLGKSVLLNVDLHGNSKLMLSENNMNLGWAIPSPDGRRLALWKDSGSLNVWLLENF
jgi:Tol biopolymer transport system component/DNA-binding winged helix-turn-helix (wHTH) protein